VEVDRSDIVSVSWTKVTKSNQLGVKTKDGLYYKFVGFRDQDVPSLSSFFQSSYGKTPDEKQLSVSGRNWGEVDLHGNTLTFLVGSKQAFEVSLADVSQTQLQGKNDVTLEFHVDDTAGANEKDSLMEISFHIPNSNTQFVGDENRPPSQVSSQTIFIICMCLKYIFFSVDAKRMSQVFNDTIVAMADVSPGVEDAVVTFESIAILTPRGRYNVELHLSFLRLQGQANDFKIQYSSVVRLFLLPKSNQPHTFVVISLDPPIRKGQTMYPHIVMQFETDTVVESELSISDELMNTKFKDKLERSYKGLIHEVFTTVLRWLSGAKITKPGKFRSSQDGFAVKSSLKAEDGVLYPLEKGFFFLPKPPTLILHDEIDYVEFERHAAGGANMHYFDLLIRLKTDHEHLFRNIQRNEYHNLYTFISSKGLKIMNLGGAGTADGVAAVLGDNDDDDAVDPHLTRIRNQAADESDEEDEDFVMGEDDDGGSPTDDSGGDDSDASEGGVGEIKEKSIKKEPKKEASSSKGLPPKRKTVAADEGSSKRKKPKKKKDPNAPKRAMSGFMFFSQMERDNIKKEHPGIAFGEVGKVLGDKWRQMSADDKEPYEAKAQVDKQRYKDEISDYKNPQPMNVDSGNDSDSN
jgi:structure-specific recognition protein 1